MKKFRVSLAQISPKLGDVDYNLKKHINYINRALKKKSDIIIFPELSLTGYSVKDLNHDLAINPYKSPLLKPLREKSKDITIVCGGIEEDENFGMYNSAFYIEDGKVKFTHRKIYPPDYGLFEEMRYFSKGKSIDVHDTRFGKIGILICEDLWHISLPLLLALQGAKVIFTLVASPTRLAIDSVSEVPKNYIINSEHHKTYSRLLSLYLVFCNRVGYEDGINFWGGSEVTDPFGNVDKVAKFFDEDLITSVINPDSVRRARHLARHFLDEDINFLRNEVKILYDELNKFR
ncbi:MAG: acyltransferase [Ignavibacteria bacterium]|nr:acyltransferase [Ignavibacteria bacterium]